MQVQIKVFANLRRYVTSPGGTINIELPEGATIAELIAALKLPSEQVKVVFVNGRARDDDWRLAPGDEVGIFPPVGGG